jgi:hypothetical protein
MISVEFLVIAAPIFMAASAIATVLISQWLNERSERRKPSGWDARK